MTGPGVSRPTGRAGRFASVTGLFEGRLWRLKQGGTACPHAPGRFGWGRVLTEREEAFVRQASIKYILARFGSGGIETGGFA